MLSRLETFPYLDYMADLTIGKVTIIRGRHLLTAAA